MMMTISSSKRSQQISSPNTFHQWSGSVKKKVKDGEWQPVYIRITRSALKCYQTETDEEPSTTFNLQSFDIQAQHEDEDKTNVLVLTNGPALVKFSWKDFKIYTYVLDGLTSHGISIQGSQKKSKKKTSEDSLGLSLKGPKIPTDIGSRLTKRFSLSRITSDIDLENRKQVRFRVDSTEESCSSDNDFSEFRSQETFVKLSSEFYGQGNISEALEIVEPIFQEEKFQANPFEIFHEKTHKSVEKESIENSDENIAKNSEEEENTTKSPDLEENTTKNRLSAIFDRAEKVGSLQRFKTLFTSRDKSAVYDIEVKPKEEFEEISTSEFITHISNHFQIADREFQHQIFEKEELETETTIDFENNLKDFEKCYEIIDQTVEVDNGILTYVNNNLTENFEVEIEEKVADVQKEELEENNLNNSEIQEDLRVEKLDSELENLNDLVFDPEGSKTSDNTEKSKLTENSTHQENHEKSELTSTEIDSLKPENSEVHEETILHISNQSQVADKEFEILTKERVFEESDEKSKIFKLQKVSNFEEEEPKVTLESLVHISNHFTVADLEVENHIQEKFLEEPKAIETSIFHVSNHFQVADQDFEKEDRFVEQEPETISTFETTEEKVVNLKVSEKWIKDETIEGYEPKLSQVEFIPCESSLEKSKEELENHDQEKYFDDNFCFDQSAVHIKFDEDKEDHEKSKSLSELHFDVKFVEQKIEINQDPVREIDEDQVDGVVGDDDETVTRVIEDHFNDLTTCVLKESHVVVQFKEVEDDDPLGITYVPKQGVFPTKSHLKHHRRQLSSSGSEQSPSICSFDTSASPLAQSKSISRSLKLKTPKLLKNYVTKQLPKSLSLSDISQAPPEEFPSVPKRVKKLKSIEEKSTKKKSPISRAVHKSVKRIKSVDLPGFVSLRNNQKLRKSVKNERIGYNVSNSTFFQTPADAAEEIPTEILQEEIVPQVIVEEDFKEGAIEEEDLSEVDETISDDQTLVHDVEAADVTVLSLQGVSDTEFYEDFQVNSELPVDDRNKENKRELIKESQIDEEEHFEEPFEDFTPSYLTLPQIESDTESNTTFYSVQSDLEDENYKKHVKFGSSLSIDRIHVCAAAEEASQIEANMSPIKKLKRLLSGAGNSRSARAKEYDVQSGHEIHTAYVDLPKISVNPLFVDQEMVEDFNDSQGDHQFYQVPKSTVVTRDEANNNPVREELIKVAEEDLSTPVFQRRLPPIYRGGPPVVTAKVETQEDFQAPEVKSAVIEDEDEECHKEVIESPLREKEENNEEFSKSKERPNSSRIHLPKEDPIYEGYLDLTTSLTSKWRRRYVKLHPNVLFILPRLTSHYATARVKLAKHRVEEPQVQPALTFCLVKRKKVTIHLKADTDHDFFHWKRHIQMVIDGQFCVEEEPLSSLDHREIINDFTPDKEVISEEEEEIKEEIKMPVPTPRNNSAIEEMPVPINDHFEEEEEEEDIPEDWKDTGEIIEIKRVINKPLKLEESVSPSSPKVETIPEEPEDQQPKSHDSEINVKEMKEFWEVATSPIKLSPISSPARSPPLWKSMPNLAKDMATQTTISSSSSDNSSESETEEIEVETEVMIAAAKLVPIEERKKAFIQGASLVNPTLPWKSMPSLNKDEIKISAPLPLVGSCYPSKLEDITLEQPIKQIKSVFEKKKSVINSIEKKMNVETTTVKPISTETEKSEVVSVEVQDTEMKNEAMLPMEEANLSCSSGANPNSAPPVVYRWDDESNGEIYTDKPILDEVDNETTTSADSIGLYVVENGREYPLVPLKERKSLFENKTISKVHHASVVKPIVKEIRVKSTSFVENQDDVKMDTVKIEEPPKARKTLMMKKTEVVKSSAMPYIIEEQEVLQNINLVSRIKTKFANGEK